MWLTENFIIHIDRSEQSFINIDRAVRSTVLGMTKFAVPNDMIGFFNSVVEIIKDPFHKIYASPLLDLIVVQELIYVCDISFSANI
jgi:hypothetical protein